MLDIREIEYWISRYEQEADKLEHCVTLSALYSIRDKMTGKQNPEHEISGYSRAAGPVIVNPISEPLDRYGDSDFLRAVEGKDPADAWRVMDEHMRTLQAINRRSYNTVLERMRNL